MEMPAPQVVQIGKRKWVLGMTWMTYGDKPTKQQIKEDAALNRMPWVAMRNGDAAIQGGFCAAIEGVKAQGLYSLGAIVADANQQPWIGIYEIAPDLYWYIAVRDSYAILPDGDVIGSWEEVRDARDRHSGYGDWTYVDGKLDDLVHLIDGVTKKPILVRSLEQKSVSPKVLGAAAALTLAVAGSGYWYYQGVQAEEAAMQARIALAKAQMAQNQAIAAKPASPAMAMTLPDDWLQACGDAVLDLPLSRYGWELTKVSCSTNAANVVWARSEGATVAIHPEGSLAADGTSVSQTLPLNIKPASIDADLLPIGQAATQIQAWAQAAGFDISLVRTKQPAALPGAEQAVLPAPPPEAAFTLLIEVSPFGLSLSHIPGVRINSMDMTETGWRIQGVVYGI